MNECQFLMVFVLSERLLLHNVSLDNICVSSTGRSKSPGGAPRATHNKTNYDDTMVENQQLQNSDNLTFNYSGATEPEKL